MATASTVGTALLCCGLILGGCSREAAIFGGQDQIDSALTKISERAAAEYPRSRSSTLSGPEAEAYILARSEALIDTWEPLPFTGELAPYDPGDFVNPATGTLMERACKGNRIWAIVESFEIRMGETPTAVRTTDGPILYEQFWEKGSPDMELFVGVRPSDRACGAIDLRNGQMSIAGDADVVAALFSAAAIRAIDGQADGSPLPTWARARAKEAASRMLRPQAAAVTSRVGEEPFVYSASDFRSLVQGKTKQEVIATLGRPIAVNDGITAGTQSYNYSSDETYLGHVPFKVTDEMTGIVQRAVHVNFGPDGRVSSVQF